jgi:hypothetical protein
MKRAMRLAMMDEAAVPSRAGLGGAFVVRCSPRSVIEDGSNNVTAGVGRSTPAHRIERSGAHLDSHPPMAWDTPWLRGLRLCRRSHRLLASGVLLATSSAAWRPRFTQEMCVLVHSNCEGCEQCKTCTADDGTAAQD